MLSIERERESANDEFSMVTFVCRMILAAEEKGKEALWLKSPEYLQGPRLQAGRSQLRVIDLAPTKHNNQTIDNRNNPVTCAEGRPDLTRIHKTIKNRKEQ